MLRQPTLDELRSISEHYHLNSTDEELKIYTEFIAHDLQTLQLLDEWQLTVPPEEHKRYQGRKSYRPKPEENERNAWYQKCSITNANAESKLLSNYRIAVKDNISVAGVPMMNGSKVLEGYVPNQDATVVKRVLDHGGTVVGKTTCENLCVSGASFNTTYGPVKNPWNPAYSAGGSSSGSGVVVATGEAEVALGGDQGGSIRIPASNCGIVGLKPTYGLVPYTGIMPIETTLDHVGPMARTVTDAARLLSAIAGFDEGKDFRQPSCGFSVPNFVDEVSSAKAGTFRIGVLKEGFNECDEKVIQCVNKAIALIKDSNVFSKVEEISIPNHDKAIIPYSAILFHGLQNQMVDGCGYGTGISGFLSADLSSKLHAGYQSQAHTLHHLAKDIILSTAYIKNDGGDAFFAKYAKAQTICWMLKQEYDRALKQYDALLMPTLPKLPAKIPTHDSTIKEIMAVSADMIRNTAPFDITHHPALSINAGYDHDTGLPIGLQLVGRLWDDAGLLKVAKLAEDVLKPLQKPFPT